MKFRLKMFTKRRKGEGCRKSSKCSKLDELVLTNARLRFCADQLHNLNYIFNKKLQSVYAKTGELFMKFSIVSEKRAQAPVN